MPKAEFGSINRSGSVAEGSHVDFWQGERNSSKPAVISIATAVAEAVESKCFSVFGGAVEFVQQLLLQLILYSKAKQFCRLVSNFLPNTRWAIIESGCKGMVTVRGCEQLDAYCLEPKDTVAGLPECAQTHFFSHFAPAPQKAE